MKSLIILITCLYVSDGQRRTAPRRTTLPGQTYGTNTFPTEPATTPSMGESTNQPQIHEAPAFQAAAVPAGFPVAGAVPAGFPVAAAVPAGFPVAAVPPGFPVAGLPSLPGAIPFSLGAPIAAGILSIPGALQLPANAVPVHVSASQENAPPPPSNDNSDEDQVDHGGKTALEKVDHTPVVGLCEEVEQILPPGTTQDECFTGDPITLRYWQPYRALRNIKCKYSENETSSQANHKERCAATYKGATCVQRYQQFVVLAAMGPAASGWACIRLGSGCSCSVRAKKRLRKTDFEQRTDLHEFMKS